MNLGPEFCCIDLDIEWMYLIAVMGQVEVEPVPEHIPDPDWGSEHQGGGWMVRWQADGLYL